jgi:hypothetical protein
MINIIFIAIAAIGTIVYLVWLGKTAYKNAKGLRKIQNYTIDEVYDRMHKDHMELYTAMDTLEVSLVKRMKENNEEQEYALDNHQDQIDILDEKIKESK